MGIHLGDVIELLEADERLNHPLLDSSDRTLLPPIDCLVIPGHSLTTRDATEESNAVETPSSSPHPSHLTDWALAFLMRWRSS
jgi:hypothetical protein